MAQWKGFTSDWNKQRWAKAREQQATYQQLTGERVSSREFYKNENRLTSSITRYEFTFEMNYNGQGYQFFIPQETIVVYGLKGAEGEAMIKESIKQGVADIFKGKSKDWMYDNVKVDKKGKASLRGIEESQEGFSYNEVDYSQLQGNGLYVKEVPKISVNKKLKNSSNKNEYNLNIWL